MYLFYISGHLHPIILFTVMKCPSKQQIITDQQFGSFPKGSFQNEKAGETWETVQSGDDPSPQRGCDYF